ncbi:MAG: hypothetical protein Kilf2KO_32970 [Rhodospirillales bacterium]
MGRYPAMGPGEKSGLSSNRSLEKQVGVSVRPSQRSDGHSFAAVWLHAKKRSKTKDLTA